jgi:probable DNA metabolism protein
MTILKCENSFDGFLSAVFDVYEYRLGDVLFQKTSEHLFGNVHEVCCTEAKSTRVWKGLKARMESGRAQQLFAAYLSELPEMNDQLMRYVRYVFDSKRNISSDYTNEAVLGVTQAAQKVHREKHRMEAFVRFKLTHDNLYYAWVEPDFNVLPLIANHFKNRYADQRWMIYDLKRKYGIHYDLKEVTSIAITQSGADKLQNTAVAEHPKELLYQELWKHYFKSVNIPSRKNVKLHIQHMPFRYWKHLTEKQ